MHIMSQGLFTNTSQSGPYRGAGRPEAAYFTERLVEQAARTIGIEPAEIAPQPDPAREAPYATPTLWNYDSGEFNACSTSASSSATGRASRRARNPPRRTASCAAARSPTTSSSAASSTSAWTCASIPTAPSTSWPAPIRTARATPPCSRSWCTTASACRSSRSATCRATPPRWRSAAAPHAARSATVGGNALLAAADAIIEKGKPLAAALMEADADLEFKDEEPRSAPTRRSQSRMSPKPPMRRPVRPRSSASDWTDRQLQRQSAEPSERLLASASWRSIRTPARSVDRYFVVDDLGRVLNPLIVRGQIHGGVVQGLGQALIEHQVYDPSPGSCSPAASWTTACRAPTRCRTSRRCWRKCPANQSAGRQGDRRIRHHRRAADGDQRADRRAQAARGRPHRHAGDAGACGRQPRAKAGAARPAS